MSQHAALQARNEASNRHATRPSLSKIAPAGAFRGTRHELSVKQAGRGEPLDQRTRNFMEPRFGYDFSQVRVHSGNEAASAAKAVRARAYVIGSDIVFGQGQYQPTTGEGKLLLAHELTHVVQQQGGYRSNAVHRKPNDASGTPSQEHHTDATERLFAIIADIERIHTKAERNSDQRKSSDFDEISNFVEKLREVASGKDEEMKLRVLSGFSSIGLQKAEAQSTGVGTKVQERQPASVAARLLMVSTPQDAVEIEADRVANAVVRGAPVEVTHSASDGVISRQAAAFAAAGGFILAAEAESAPLTVWNPPGWVVLGVATLAAGALIGASILMSSPKAPELSQAEQEAVENKENGKPYDKDVFERAMRKLRQGEKFDGLRNKQKRKSN